MGVPSMCHQTEPEPHDSARKAFRDLYNERVTVPVPGGEPRECSRLQRYMLKLDEHAVGDDINPASVASLKLIHDVAFPRSSDGKVAPTLVVNVLPQAEAFTRKVLSNSGMDPPTPDSIVDVLAGMGEPALLPAPNEAIPDGRAAIGYKPDQYGNTEADHTPHTPPDLEGDKPTYGALTDSLAPIPEPLEPDTDE